MLIIPFKPFVAILDTRELVQELAASDGLFHFYPSGIRGVLSDSFAMSAATYDLNGSSVQMFRDLGRQTGLMGSVLDSFEEYAQRFDPMDPTPWEQLEEIELIVDIIEQRTDELLRSRYPCTHYQIIRPIQWAADDLVIHMRMF